MKGHLQWSKLKARIESLFAPSIRKRVQLHSTWYKSTGQYAGRAWITVDGEEIGDFSDARWWRGYYTLALQFQEISNSTDYRDSTKRARHFEAYREAEGVLARSGVLSRNEFYEAVLEYPNLTVDKAWESGLPLFRAFALLDRRMGKRRLEALELFAEEHPVVRRLLAFRLEAEGLQREHAS